MCFKPDFDERKSSRPRSILRSIRHSIISISSQQGSECSTPKLHMDRYQSAFPSKLYVGATSGRGLLTLFLPLRRDLTPESPTSWILQRSSGSVSANAVDDMVTVGDTEVKMRKTKKKKKRSSMIFITEERERTSTLDCKRVRGGGRREEGRERKGGGGHCLC